MQCLHKDFWIGPEDVVIVTLDGQANVLLMDDANFSSYRCGRSTYYVGGWATRSPVRLSPETRGHWHLVVDMGGRAGSVRAGIQLIRRVPTAPYA